MEAWGRIREILKADESRETYEYDLAGNVISATDGENHQVKYSYNTSGSLSSRTDAGGNTEYFHYDIEGRLNKHRDRNGSETTFYYNMYHDPVRREHKASGLQEIYGYRKDGSLSYAIGGGMRYDYTYYPDGKLHEKKASGRILLSFQYDLNGNKVQRSGITGKSTTYTYNALDLLEEICDAEFFARYSYHSNGMIKSLNVGDKLITHYEYDRDKNLTRQWIKMRGEVKEEKRIRLGIPTKDADNMTLLADYHYSYDGNGNRVSKESLTGKTSYQYDTLNRLVKVQYPKGLEEFTYDKADNRIRRLTEKEEEIYKYDVCNRLVEKQTRRPAENSAGTAGNMGKAINPQKVENMKPQGSYNTEAGHGKEVNLPYASGNQNNLIPFQSSTFQYDNQGNLLREERKTGNSRQESIYTYDGFNRQKKIVNFESKMQVNHYDGEGLRHEMEENGNLIKFLYVDREVVSEEKEDGNVRRFIRGYDLVASDSESARTYYHYVSDEQGSITHILGEDENGEYSLKNYYEYGAFGDFCVKEEEVENRFGYNGEVFDPIGGQYYLRARYYNPIIGRFTQEDTYYGAGLNLYAYCKNLPVGYIDPSGHKPCQEKLDLYKKYRKQGLSKKEADIQSNYDLIKKNQGKKAAEKYITNERMKQQLIASGMTPKQASDYIKQKEQSSSNFSEKWNAYLTDIKKYTGVKIQNKQLKKLFKELRKNSHDTKLSGNAYKKHRKKDWKKNKNKLIEEWEKQTGVLWPRYGANDAANSGYKTHKEDYRYDAHEIIPNVYDSPMNWWNLIPAANGNEHQGGIHRSDGSINNIFPGSE